MVRARRVRAVVACTENDECCSPNPKRKDQGNMIHNVSVNTAITQFFTPVKSTNLDCSILPDLSDLDDVEKEKFKELPDVLDDITADKYTSTPHRIELHDDKEDNSNIKNMKPLQEGTNSLLHTLDLSVPFDEIITKAAKPQIENITEKIINGEKNTIQTIMTENNNKQVHTTSKVRRRLNNNQSSNQQPLRAKTVSKNNADSKPNNHKLTDYFPVRRSERKTKKTMLEEKQRTIEDNLRQGNEKGLTIYNFDGKGRGIVSLRLFNRGDFVVEYAGDLIDMQEARRRELKYAQDQNTGCYMYYFKHKNTQYCIDATAETGRLGRLVNHSRNGNLITRVIDVDQIPRLVLVAKDTIEVGDEVTYDYGDRSKESLKHHPWLAY